MPQEIERKWLCEDWPPDCKLLGEWRIEQSYLYVDKNIEVRVRKKCGAKDEREDTTSYVFSNKFGEGISRIELETHLEKYEYFRFLETLDPPVKPIEKIYRVYDYNGFEVEVSIVDGAWMYAEIEFTSLQEAHAFEALPEWGFQEVTGNPWYNMKNYWVRKQNIRP